MGSELRQRRMFREKQMDGVLPMGSTNQSHHSEEDALGIVHLDDLFHGSYDDENNGNAMNCIYNKSDGGCGGASNNNNNSNSSSSSSSNNNNSNGGTMNSSNQQSSPQGMMDEFSKSRRLCGVNSSNNNNSPSPPVSSGQVGGDVSREAGNNNNSGQIQHHRSLRDPPTHGLTADKWSKLQNLQALYEQGFILETEFKERRSQLIDELTGTRSTIGDSGTSTSTATSHGVHFSRMRKRKSRVPSSIVVPRPPPDFSNIPVEHAIKHYFDLSTRTWHSEEVLIRLDDTPFARGGLRLVYHLQEVSGEEAVAMTVLDSLLPLEKVSEEGSSFFAEEMGFLAPPPSSNAEFPIFEEGEQQEQAQEVEEEEQQKHQQELLSVDKSQQQTATVEEARINTKKRRTKKTTYVAKIAIDPNEDPSTYFRDVEMQAHCAHYALLFNTYKPPRVVEFCKAWILELVEREGRPLCAVERFVAGDYRKHNNNYGYVSEDERNTPQAFSHFTYEASAHTMLVVDIQGVGDMYTDPQIHTLNGTDFGKGNLGIKGFDRFLSTHRCNRICRYLKLPPVNPKYTMEGTIPNLPFMPATKINKSHFREGHYFEETPALQKYLISNNIIQAKARRNKIRYNFNESSEDDSFLRLWATREQSEGFCSFCPCTIL